MINIHPTLFKPYAGIYEVPAVDKLTVPVKDTGAYIQADPLGPEPQELLPKSNTQFFVLSSNITFTFQKDDQGAVTGLILHAALNIRSKDIS